MVLVPVRRVLTSGLPSPWTCGWCGQRHASSSRPARVMAAWQATGYGGLDKLTMSRSASVPSLRHPDDVLVKVHAASINNVDAKMLGGYGAGPLNALRAVQGLVPGQSEFPLVPGRDFSGVVVRTGRGAAASRLKPGDQVWGAVMPVRAQGSLAEYVIAPSVGVTGKPAGVSHIEAASIPFVALTSWTALCTMGRLSASNASRKRVLILGGSGGVGTFSIQLLRAWGADVTVTCPGDAVQLVTDLGAVAALDYKFNVILDCTADQPARYSHLLTPHLCASYITLLSPMVQNADQHGLLLGTAKSALSLVPRILQGQIPGQSYHWAVVQNSPEALRTVAQLVSAQEIRAVVDEKFDFADVPAAYRKLARGPNRGKTVIDMSQINDTS